MAVSVEVPNLGEEMAGGVVAEWYVADGAEVAAGDVVCRVECSFVAVEVEAPGAGLLRQGKPVGSIERPGSTLGLIVAGGEDLPPNQPQAANAKARPDRAVEAAPSDFEAAAQAHQALAQEPTPEPTAVVVPFPRRFVQQTNPGWEPAPGDAVAFASSLFEPAGTPADLLAEPGGSIPGLPLWEPEDERAGSATFSEPSGLLARISAEVEFTAQVLTMSVVIDMAECSRMLAVCRREWLPSGVAPALEDLVLRAVAKATAEMGLPADTAGLVLVGGASETSAAVADAGSRSLREAVAARATGGGGYLESSDFTLTSFAALGIGSATPRLSEDTIMAFAMGAPGRDGHCTLTMAYGSTRLGEATAARLLARTREILEAPYAMLV